MRKDINKIISDGGECFDIAGRHNGVGEEGIYIWHHKDLLGEVTFEHNLRRRRRRRRSPERSAREGTSLSSAKAPREMPDCF